MKTLKTKARAIPKDIPKINTEPTSSEEEPSKNVKEIKEDIGNGLKTLLFTLTWLEKLNGPQAKEYQDDFISNVADIIDHTESRTQLALFVRGLNDILDKDAPAFDPEEFKKNINLKTDQQISIDPETLKNNKKNIKAQIANKLKQKLEDNLHYGEGLLKVWNWSGFFDQDDQAIFDKDRGMFNEEGKNKDLDLRKLMQFDICFLNGAIADYKKGNKGNTIPKYLDLVYEKYAKKVQKNYSCEKIEKQLYDKGLIIEWFGVILMGVRFSDVYSILDHFEIDFVEGRAEEKANSLFGKALSISNHKKKYIGRVFHDIYISQLHFRENNFKGNYHNPIETFNEEVKNCLIATYDRNDVNDQRARCPLDANNYQEQYQLLAYQRANETQSYKHDKNKEKELVENLNVEVGKKRGKVDSGVNLMSLNTILVHIFLLHSESPNINGHSICEKNPECQLCKEHK